MKRNYARLEIVPFGQHLLRTGDLDPVYLALRAAELPSTMLRRWLVAYWCLYHCGAASWLAEQEGYEFWRWLAVAAANGDWAPVGPDVRWPRGKERRHFRGAAAIQAVEELRERYGERPEDMVEYIATGNMTVASVMARAQEHRLFGTWIAFKVADMLDAVLGQLVDQKDLAPFLYETPRKSIMRHWEQWLPGQEIVDERAALIGGMKWLRRELSDQTIPHKPGTPPDNFTLETIWCKHLSHVNGHYPLLNDIKEITEGVEPWLSVSETANKFLTNMPAGGTL